jgi:hypothetical protein
MLTQINADGDFSALAARPIAEGHDHPELGPVALLTIRTGPGARLAVAHAVANDLERDLRIEYPELADVVVHTAPRPAPPNSDAAG